MIAPAFTTTIPITSSRSFLSTSLTTRRPCVLHSSRTHSPAFSIVPRATTRAALPPLNDERRFNVNPDDGEESFTGVPLTSGNTALPTGPIDPLGISTSRLAEAYVIAPDEYESVVIFAHGFSQRPRNYQSLLCTLAATGKLVLAPRVWLLSTILPLVEIRTMQPWSNPAARLQTAILIDTMRCVKIAEQMNLDYEIYGHSMGGALALTAGWWLRSEATKGFRSVVSLSPALSASCKTALNPVVALNNKDGPELLKKMANEYGNVPLLVLHGADDILVRTDAVTTLFESFDDAKRNMYMIWGDITEGTHVGFQDKLNVDLFNRFYNFQLWLAQNLFFQVLNLLVYGSRDDLSQDNRAQLSVSKEILREWVKLVKDNANFATVQETLRKAAADGPGMNWNWASGDGKSGLHD